jgi:curved DNA-binding protein CbpA
VNESEKLEKALNILGLKADASPGDARNAYRTLAKKNHPDRFTDENRKRRQEEIMAGINDAYKIIYKYLKNIKTGAAGVKKNAGEDDYSLYKKGIEYYNKCFEGVFIRMEKHNLKEKGKNLVEAASYFNRLLLSYPESDWAYDSEEKLRKIEKMTENLKRTEAGDYTWTPKGTPRRDAGFYGRKFDELFRELFRK